MALVLDLRRRLFHAGVPLVHRTSEHVVLANVFGTIKNLSADAALNPWLRAATSQDSIASTDWTPAFWEKQKKPIGPVGEGNTEVDLVLESGRWLVFVEVKMDAAPSQGTTSDPDRNQLLRNLDIGYRRAVSAQKEFALIYVTPDAAAPEIVERLRNDQRPFPANADVDPSKICACLFWSSWGLIGDVLAKSYGAGTLDAVERKFTLDLLAYLSEKRLWNNTLADDPVFYADKLYRSLRRNDSPFIPYGKNKEERYQGWRKKPWQEEKLRAYLNGLRPAHKALLKLIADAGGALQQRAIMQGLPFLKGRSSLSLGRLKSAVNAGCRQLDCAPILAEGTGSGDHRIHEINRGLGDLRSVVITIARECEIEWHLLERETAPVE